MVSFLVCGFTTPTLSFCQLPRQGNGCIMDKDNMQIFLDERFQIPNVQHVFIDPSFC